MNAGNKNTQHAPSTKTECDYLNGWIKKRSHTQKSHPKVVNPRDIAGERKKKTKTKQKKNNKKPKKTSSGCENDFECNIGWTGWEMEKEVEGGGGRGGIIYFTTNSS